MNYEWDRLVQALSGTFLGDELKALSDVYDQVEEETNAFCHTWHVSCTFGCGSCCEHFIPDITPVEARLVAAYLLLSCKDISLLDKVQNKPSDSDGCPLWRKDDPYHCSVYPVRPLICRLFGQCPSRMKDGSAELRPCKFHQQTFNQILSFAPSDGVKTMDDYGMQLRSLDSGEGNDVEDLDKAVGEALSSVSLIIRLAGIAMQGDDDSTPSPMAS